MASFKELKNKILKADEVEVSEPKILENKEKNQFELEEARYMLKLIADTNFKGSDVQIIYNIALKLQTTIKELND